MTWEIVVGIETHAQLATRSKIFSGASTTFGAAPNTQASAVDLALPGVLPVLNRAAVELALRFGLAIGATINRRSVFARKNYFYPDLPKGYQISQYEAPVVQGGALVIVLPEEEKTIRITRAHLEEDAGKSVHEDPKGALAGASLGGMSGIDLNRAGTPLLEIVSEPDLRGPKEAVAYARTLHGLVRWIGICDGNMQEGSFRCDANVSVRRAGEAKLGTRCEIKNLNSFRFLERAIEFEARRQIELLEQGGRVEQETRLYDPQRDETRAMRTKEEAQDYRYFPDPDLLPLIITEDDIERARRTMPELPAARRRHFVALGISAVQADLFTSSIELATYATQALAGVPEEGASTVANWIVGPLSAKLNETGLEIVHSRVSAEQLRHLAARIDDGTLSGKMAKAVFDAMWAGEGAVDEIIERRGLRQIRDAGAIEKLVEEVLAAHPGLIEDYRAGKEKAFNALVGQVMKASRGQANPAQVNRLLRARLAAR